MAIFHNFPGLQGISSGDILISLAIANVYFVLMIAGKTDFNSANFEKMAFHRFCIAFVVICGMHILNELVQLILLRALKAQTSLWFIFGPYYGTISIITIMILPSLWLGSAVWSAFALTSKTLDHLHCKWLGVCLLAWLVAIGIGKAFSYVEVA